MKQTFRVRAQHRADRIGITHYIGLNGKNCKCKIFRHGQLIPRGWRVIDTIAPEKPSDKDATIDRMLSRSCD